MAPTVDDANDELNTKLYCALLEDKEAKVIELCQNIPEGPLHVLTIHGDTVLHMATYSKQKNLVCDLLHMRQLSEHHSDKLMHKNDIGNTILHEAAISDEAVQAAKIMLRMAPDLLSACNDFGETALFRAARYGRKKMFEFLDSEVNERAKLSESDPREFHQRNDKTTILHISILCMHFDLALLIAKRYEYLVNKQDKADMTGLQLLSCDNSAFRSRFKGKYLKKVRKFFYSGISTEDTTRQTGEGFRVPLWEAIRAEEQSYESAVQLAKFLTGKDTSWKATKSTKGESNPQTHTYASSSTVLQPQDHVASKNKNVAGTPLMLATKNGCTEIVDAILDKYPQAVEHVDGEGRNILHLAIKHRCIHIFDKVERMGFPMIRLIRKLDNNGNTILHYVGLEKEAQKAEDMRSPALLLQEDLRLFERVQKVTATHFVKHFNKDEKTAEQLFTAKNAKLHENAKNWLKRTAENCTVVATVLIATVAVLIATVAFAAAYTVPGGPNQTIGYPILVDRPFFVIFTVTDTLALTFALTSVIMFLSILTSPFQLMDDFKQSLPLNLMLGLTFLIFSVSMMMLAFAATILFLIRNREQWTKVALYSVAFFPVTMFALSYIPLYMSLIEILEYPLKRIRAVFPRSSCLTFKPFKVRISHARNPDSSTQPSTLKTTRCPV